MPDQNILLYESAALEPVTRGETLYIFCLVSSLPSKWLHVSKQLGRGTWVVVALSCRAPWGAAQRRENKVPAVIITETPIYSTHVFM